MFTDLSNKLDDDSVIRLASTLVFGPLWAIVLLASLAELARNIL